MFIPATKPPFNLREEGRKDTGKKLSLVPPRKNRHLGTPILILFRCYSNSYMIRFAYADYCFGFVLVFFGGGGWGKKCFLLVFYLQSQLLHLASSMNTQKGEYQLKVTYAFTFRTCKRPNKLFSPCTKHSPKSIPSPHFTIQRSEDYMSVDSLPQ